MKSFDRIPFDARAYEERIQTHPCFICAMIAGKLDGNHIVYQNDQAIVFLNKYPTLYGYTLVAPREHREQVTGDFDIYQYIGLQKLIYCVAEAVREETNAERVYILSLGSQQGNKHVHWHVAPLPPGVPFEQQQLEALRFRNGVLKIPEEELSAFATRLRVRIQQTHQPFIRTIALCAFRHNGRILVFEGYDPKKEQIFYRPLGGGVNPGEYGRDAIVREIREEIDAEIKDVRYLGTLENIFMYDGKPGHEIVLMFDAEFVNVSFYHQESIPGQDDGNDSLKVLWKSIDEFQQAGAAPLYPNGLLKLLRDAEQ